MNPTTAWPNSVTSYSPDSRREQEVVELPLLLPRWQAAALEEAARSRGMTTGQMLRRMIAGLFAEEPVGR